MRGYFNNVTEIHSLSNEVATNMVGSKQSTVDLSKATEAVQELVSRFKIGRGAFDLNVDEGHAFQMRFQVNWPNCSSVASNIWGQNFTPISDQPAEVQRQLCRRFRARSPAHPGVGSGADEGGIYTIIIDSRGYSALQPEVLETTDRRLPDRFRR